MIGSVQRKAFLFACQRRKESGESSGLGLKLIADDFLLIEVYEWIYIIMVDDYNLGIFHVIFFARFFGGFFLMVMLTFSQ